MPGAWEYERPSVLVAILTRGVVPTIWATGYRDFRLPATGKPVFLSGMPYDHARNTAVEAALNGGYQWLMFLDDDVIPPPDAFFRLAAHQKDIISGLYLRRAEPIVPVAMVDTEQGPSWITEFTPGAMLEPDLVGAGCLLINRLVLERVTHPWFEWLLDRRDLPQSQKVSEDFAFCRKAKNAGFRIFLDTSVQCRHAGYGASHPNGTFRPLEA